MPMPLSRTRIQTVGGWPSIVLVLVLVLVLDPDVASPVSFEHEDEDEDDFGLSTPADRQTDPPSGVYLMALFRRLVTSWSSQRRSPVTSTSGSSPSSRATERARATRSRGS